jgi:uncharacterized DUF497 family protein
MLKKSSGRIVSSASSAFEFAPQKQNSGLTPATTAVIIYDNQGPPMPHLEFIWIDGPEGNIEHLAEHGITVQEAERVMTNPIATDSSTTTGRPIAFGFTRAGRKLAVVYEQIDPITVYVITAFDVEN